MEQKSRITVTWSPRATKDLLDIYDYLARAHAPDIAEDTVLRIRETADKLRMHPLLWKQREGLEDIRLAPAHPYFICYRHEKGMLGIVRVVHEKRDIVAI